MRNMKDEDGCKRPTIAARRLPPKFGAVRLQHDEGYNPRQSPESHSDGEACGVTLVSLKAEKDPVAAAFMSMQLMRGVIHRVKR